MNWLWQGKNDVVFKTSERKHREKIRKNIIVFTCSAVVLILFAIFVIMWSYDFKISNAISDSGGKIEENVDETDDLPIVSGSAKFMFFISDDIKENLLSLSVVNVDLDKNKITVMSIPVNEKIFVRNEKEISPSKCYVNYGAEELRSELEVCLGTEIQKYYGCLEGNFESIVANFNEFEYTFKRNYTLKHNEDTFNISKGNKKYTDSELLKILTYKGFDNEEKIKGEVFSSMLKQYLNENTSANSSVIFTNLIGVGESDISVVDFADEKSAIIYLSSNKVKKTFNVVTDLDYFNEAEN